MNEQLVDLSQYDREIDERRKRVERYQNAYRESAKQNIKHMRDHAERSVEYCKSLIAVNADVTDELAEIEEVGRSLILLAGILRMGKRNG